MTRATLSIIDNLVKYMIAAEIMAKLQQEGKKYRKGANNSLVQYTIVERIFELSYNYKPFVAEKHASLEEEVARLQHKNAALQAAVYQIQKKEAENERHIVIGEKWIS